MSGYKGDADVPDYRVITAPILIDGVSGNNHIERQQISELDLPDVAQEAGLSETLILRQPIGQLENLAQRGAAGNEYVRLGASWECNPRKDHDW